MISVGMNFPKEEFNLLLFCSKIVKRTKTNFGITRIKIPIPTPSSHCKGYGSNHMLRFMKIVIHNFSPLQDITSQIMNLHTLANTGFYWILPVQKNHLENVMRNSTE